MNFEQLLDKYAEVCIKIGVNVGKGQRLIIRAPLEAQTLVHHLTRHAYDVGAEVVEVNWIDPALNKIRLTHAEEKSLTITPDWQIEHMTDYARQGHAMLSIAGGDPDLMADVDPKRMMMSQKALGKASEEFRLLSSASAMNWCVILAPHPAMNAKVFPDEDAATAEAKMWEAIFEMCRVNQADPVAAWQAHVTELEARAEYLQNKRYSQLHYQSGETNLRVGLPDGHIWKSASEKAQNGITGIPNIPTEEVFTLAHKDQIEGVVKSTKPLVYNGALIENFTLQFSEGSVVSAKAEKGQTALDNLLKMDEGARSIGELALVPHSSPISQSGLIFYNTLYDENASSHIALGRAYRFSLDGGTTMSEDEFGAAGGNTSITHVDFMMGSETLDIDGITSDGQSEPIMRGGEWAFEV
ncbi:MAG: aminopeptidase [Aggregatilineales bacterium]